METNQPPSSEYMHSYPSDNLKVFCSQLKSGPQLLRISSQYFFSFVEAMIRIAVLLSIIFLPSSSTVIDAASIISPRSFEPDPDRLRQINAEEPPLSDPELPDSCLDVLEELMPCLDYLIDDDDKPSEDCCSGAKEVVNDNKTKQETCRCLKAVLTGFDSRRFSQISEQCGLSLALPPIDATFDCSSLKD